MKSTGIIRPMDRLGRFVIPMELRRSMGIGVKDMLEILVDGDEIILRRHSGECVFCGASEELAPFKNRLVCPSCLAELKG